MNLGSRKGRVPITLVAGALGVLLVGLFFISFTARAAISIPEQTSDIVCCNTQERVAEAKGAVDAGFDKAKLHSPDNAWDGNWDASDNLQSFGMWMSGTDEEWNGAMDGMADGINKNLKPACKEMPSTCIGDAAYVGECLYRKAVKTFYTVRGGKSYALLEKDGEKFNLHKIKVNVTEPGTVSLPGSCDNYVDTVALRCELGAGHYTEDRPEYYGYPCYTRISEGTANEKCEITFDTVDELTMTLSMMALCQNTTYGPVDTGCKCFAKPDLGYTCALDNGLPNSAVDRDVHFHNFLKEEAAETVTYGEDYLSYLGCGFDSPDMDSATGIVDVGVNMGNDKIVWTYKVDIGAGEYDYVVKWERGGVPVGEGVWSDYRIAEYMYVRVEGSSHAPEYQKVVISPSPTKGWEYEEP